MGLFDKEQETRQKLKEAQAEVQRLRAELESTRNELNNLKNIHSRSSNNFATIIAKFWAEISKLSQFTNSAVVYRYRVLLCTFEHLLVPLANESGNQDAVETLKQIQEIIPKDFTELMTGRYLLLKRPNFDYQDMKKRLDLVPGANLSEESLAEAEAFKKAAQSQELADKMYTYFADKIRNMKKNNNFDPKTWLESILNMGMIAADWAYGLHTGADMIYCPNYNRIMNEFSDKYSHEFRFNDVWKSTDQSNAVYEIIEKLVETFGIERSKLMFTVDTYLINGKFVPEPEQTQPTQTFINDGNTR